MGRGAISFSRGRGGGRGGGRGRGGSRGGGGGGRGGGRGRGDGRKLSDLYSHRHKRIFNTSHDDDDLGDADDGGIQADDFYLDDVTGGVDNFMRGEDDDEAAAGQHAAGRRAAAQADQEADERAMQKLQNKIDRKDQRKKGKVEAKERRIAAQAAWAKQCQERRKAREEERKKRIEAEKKQRQKELEKHKKEMAKKQHQQQREQQREQGTKKKGVQFDVPAKTDKKQQQPSQPKQQQQQQPQQKAAPTTSKAQEQQQQQQSLAAVDAAPAAVSPPQQQQQQQQQQQTKQPTTTSKYVPPAARKNLAASLTAQVQRIMNKLVIDNAGDLVRDVINLFESGAHSRNDVIAATGDTMIASTIHTHHLTTQQALAFSCVVRALELKCGIDVGATLVSRIATELRAAMLLGQDQPSTVHTSKFLDENDRRASHGAMMLGCLTHLSCCSPHLALSFLEDATSVLREISEHEDHQAAVAPSNTTTRTSFVNEMNCVASACLQLLRVAGDKLRDIARQRLNDWVNKLRPYVMKKTSSSSSSSSTTNFASLKLETVFTRAEQYVSGRRQRSDTNSSDDQSPDEKLLTKVIDVLAEVARPGASPRDKRAWKSSFSIIAVPNIFWDLTSQPQKQGVRWWEQQQQQQQQNADAAAEDDSSAVDDEAKKKEAALNAMFSLSSSSAAAASTTGVERRELLLSASKKEEHDDALLLEEDDEEELDEFLDEEDDDYEMDHDEEDEEAADTEEDKALRRQKEIKQLRTFEGAASGQRFISERQRSILQVLDTAFDDGEATQRLLLIVQQSNDVSDVASVIIQCCAQEATFNPFYAKIACRLLPTAGANISHAAAQRKNERKVKRAFQFALWDKFGSFRIAASSGQHVPDVAAQVNLACFITHLFAEEKFDLALLRGLDIDANIPATVGLFLRILILRMLLVLEFPSQVVSLFFAHAKPGSGKKGEQESELEEDEDDSGNVHSVVGARSVIKPKVRDALLNFFDQYFVENKSKSKTNNTDWILPLFDVVAGSTLSEEDLNDVIEEIPKRIKTARRALKEGGE